MERRYGIGIAVQASDRMQGANFAIERSAVQVVAPQRATERAVVNMESGFERQDGDDDVVEETEELPAREADGRRPRRRRRRGRRDERGGDERPAQREHHGGERAEFAHTGEVEDVDPEMPAYADQPEAREDLVEEPADNPAGFGDQPSIAHGESDREDRPGRRRRRGRRGGRRGRDRDDAPREQQDQQTGEHVVAHHEGESGNGALEPDADRPAERETFQEERSATAAPEALPEPEPARTQPDEPRYEPTVRESAPEPHWRAPADRNGEAGAPLAAPVAESRPPREPEPVHAQPASEPAHEDPSRPVRKGWWQRRFSGD